MCNIAKYNDLVRLALIDPLVKQLLDDEGCRFRVYMTTQLQHCIENQAGLIRAVACFNHFNEQNDPYGEHDFIRFKFEDHWINAKIDDWLNESIPDRLDIALWLKEKMQ